MTRRNADQAPELSIHAGEGVPELTSFVGRRDEIVHVRALLASTRLVTITGPGGVGKTRLALRLVHDVGRSQREVFVVELASLRDPQLVGHSIAAQVGAPETSATPAAILAEFFQDRDALLLVDNCEHLLDSVARAANDLLRNAPRIRILATSRQPLGVPGEHAFPLSPLPLPASGVKVAKGMELLYPALQLFRDRARAVLPDFEIHDGNRADIARLCTQLEGIPLAIELAAVRLRVLSVAEMADRLGQRFDLLTLGARTVEARHQTLRATIDWSHDLCTAAEQTLWARASTFAGGFGLAAAESVCSSSDLPRADILDTLTGLVEKSILLAEDAEGSRRFRMLETVREYGESRLAESPTDCSATRHRHVEWCAGLLEDATRDWFTSAQLDWSARLRREYPNLRKAFDFCLGDDGDVRRGQYLIGRHWFLWVCVFLSEGRHWLDRAIAADPSPTAERAEALAAFGYVAALQGDGDLARPYVAELVKITDTLSDSRLTAYARHVMGLAELFSDPVRAVEQLTTAVAAYKAAAAEWELTIGAQIQLGLAHIFLEDIDEARRLFADAGAITASHGEQWEYSYATYGIGFVDLVDGDATSAADRAREAIGVKRSLSDALGLALSLDLLGWTLPQLREYERAGVVLGAAYRLWDSLGHQLFNAPHWLERRAAAQRTASDAIGEKAFLAAVARGRAMQLDVALRYATGESEPHETDQTDQTAASLSKRERQIAEFIAAGQSNKDIAANLVISQRTVESHVDHIFTKLGFNSRSQVAAWIVERRDGTTNA